MQSRTFHLALCCVIGCLPVLAGSANDSWSLPGAPPTASFEHSHADRYESALPDGAGTLYYELPECRIAIIDEVALSADQAGVLSDVRFAEGDYVEPGDIVAALRDGIVRSALATAEKEAENDVEVRFARKAADVARVAYLRAMQANQSLAGTLPELEVRELRLAAEKAVLQVEQAEHRLIIAGLHRDEAREKLQSYVIQAPFGGTVTRVHKRRGEAVRQGEPILELENSTRMRVEGYLPLKQAWTITAGTPVSLRISTLDRDADLEQLAFSGRIVMLDTKVEPVTQQVRVWAEIDNHSGLLKDGMTGVLQVPAPGSPAAARSTAPRSPSPQG